MKKMIVSAVLVACVVPASAQDLGGVLRTIGRGANGANTTGPGQALPGVMTVPANAADVASMKASLDRAVAPRTSAALALASARPVVERVLMTVGCATSAKALHVLNRDRLTPETYRTLDDDLHYTAMGVGSLMTHNRRQCMQVARVAELKRPTLNSLSIRTYFVSPSSGEARILTTSFRLMDGAWLIDKINWFARS